MLRPPTTYKLHKNHLQVLVSVDWGCACLQKGTRLHLDTERQLVNLKGSQHCTIYARLARERANECDVLTALLHYNK